VTLNEPDIVYSVFLCCNIICAGWAQWYYNGVSKAAMKDKWIRCCLFFLI